MIFSVYTLNEKKYLENHEVALILYTFAPNLEKRNPIQKKVSIILNYKNEHLHFKFKF